MKRGVLAFLAGVLVLGPLAAQAVPASTDTATNSDTPTAAPGPILYGDNNGRLWKWQDGVRTLLTPDTLSLTLGGLRDGSLWGWTTNNGKSRFFTIKLPRKGSDEVPAPRLVGSEFSTPSRADWQGDRRLLIYENDDGSLHWEVWKGKEQVSVQGYDDGRTLYAASLGPKAGWILVGRTQANRPWLNLSGIDTPAPDGWEGRLSVALWVPEKADKDSGAPSAGKASSKPKAPPSVHPWAAGWGAVPPALPQLIWWGPNGWQQPAEALPDGSAGVYPQLGAPGKLGAPVYGGWAADAGTGTLHPWFWDGTAAFVGQTQSDGQPVLLFAGGKNGTALVVQHTSAPWFTLEDGKTSVPLGGLQPDDRVVTADVPAEPQTSP